MIKNILIKKNAGLTIIELTIAVSIVGIISLIAFQFVNDQQKSAKKIEDAIEYKIDTLLADKVILKDFRNASPSINQLYVADNNANNFYDYDPDKNGELYKLSPFKFRVITLDSTNYTTKKLYVLTVNQGRGESVFTEPVVAYSIGASPTTDINLPAPITFEGLNKNLFLYTKNPLLNGTLVAVESSSPMKVTTNNKSVRSAMYVGFSNSVGNVVPNPVLPDSIFTSNIYSEDAANAEVIITPTNFDDFLQKLPANGTTGSSIKIQAVKLIRYRLSCEAGTTKCNLDRSEWEGAAGFANERTILPNIKSVTFRRTDLTNTLSTVSYVQNK